MLYPEINNIRNKQQPLFSPQLLPRGRCQGPAQFLCPHVRFSSFSCCQLTRHLHLEAVIRALQKPAGLRVPCCVVTPAEPGGNGVLHEDQDLLTEASSAVCSFACFLLITVPAAETHNNPVSDVGVPTNPDLWVLSWVTNPP